MELLWRLALAIFGVLAGLLGLIAIATSFLLMTLDLYEGDKTSGAIVMGLFKFVICEILLMFGVTAVLVGLRYVVGRRAWIVRILDYTWKRTMRFAFIMAGVTMICGAISSLMRLIF